MCFHLNIRSRNAAWGYERHNSAVMAFASFIDTSCCLGCSTFSSKERAFLLVLTAVKCHSIDWDRDFLKGLISQKVLQKNTSL